MRLRMRLLVTVALFLPSAGPAPGQRLATGAPLAAARPIWLPGASGRPETIYFRQPFTLRELPAAARLQVAAPGRFVAYLNGAAALEAEGGSAAREVWVTRFMRAGRNVLAFECRPAAGANGLSFDLMLRFRDGRTARVVSNGGERASGRFQAGWQGPDFDDRRWAAARVASGTPEAARPAPAAGPRPGSPPRAKHPALTAGYDASRLVRVWDIQAEGRPGTDPYARPRATGERMLMTSSVPAPADFTAVASAGFTLFQTDSDHLSTEETAPGVWDFRGPDAALKAVRQRGFDWCYFPHYAFPPKWYREQVPFTRIRCMEHNRTVEAFSPWEPKLGPFAARGYEQIARHYRSTPGAPPSALYLGVHGDYGECGLLMGARVAVPGQREDWQRRFGNLHDHVGWWCADPLARAAFRAAMLRKYHDLDVLNAAWKTRFAAPEEIAYPAGPNGVARRRWLDFVQWYTDSVSGLVDAVCRIARRTFPDTLLMLPVGFGDENPRGGNDNSMAPKIAARYHADVRSTHGGFQPFAQNQATMLGRIASACRFYGAPFWTEPPSRITAEGQVARIFEAVSQGAHGFFDWADNVRDTREVYYRFGKHMRIERPIVDVAMFYPTTSHLLHPDEGFPQVFAQGCAAIRDVLNYDTVDERMIQDGALDRYRVLVLWEGTVVEKETLDRIRDWVQAGGVLAAYDFGKIETVEGDRSWFNELFGYAGRLRPAGVGLRYAPEGRAPLAGRYRISVGQPGSASFLAGDWYEAETLGGVARRWTGASAEVRVPVDPARAWMLSVRASFPPEAARFRREVLVNGVRVGVIDQAAETTYRFPVPASALAGRGVAVVTIRSETWAPASVLRGSQDRRPLGTWVTYVEMDSTSGPAPAGDPGPPAGRVETTVDLRRLRSEWARRSGRGWTVYLPATRRQLPAYMEVVRYLTYHLSELDGSRRDAIAVDDAWDGLYATLLNDRILYYNPGPSPVTRTIVLPQAAFAGRTDLLTPSRFTHTLTVEPNAIAAIDFAAPPQELLLQCEKFTEPGGLRPRAGAEFSPGRGATHVLLPAGRQIATRFQCDVPGRYRVFYRAARLGAPAPAEVLLDGRRVESREPAGEKREQAVSQTLLAGTVSLSRGIHSLALRAGRDGELGADFVVLTTDPTIAGYGFGVRAAGR